MIKRMYIVLTATFILLTYSSYHVNVSAKSVNKIRPVEEVDRNAGHSTGKILITNVTCGGNLSN